MIEDVAIEKRYKIQLALGFLEVSEKFLLENESLLLKMSRQKPIPIAVNKRNQSDERHAS
jgi:hypothetical protein